VIVDSLIRLICVAYISALNASIGLYIGLLGASGFARPRPVALFIMLLGMVAPLLLLYAQNTYGYRAPPSHIMTSVAFFVAAYIVGRALRQLTALRAAADAER
jgi:hypothetical protein